MDNQFAVISVNKGWGVSDQDGPVVRVYEYTNKSEALRLAKWLNTRQYVENLYDAAGCPSIVRERGGYIYAVGYIEEGDDNTFCVTVFNDGLQTRNLIDAELFLWDHFGTDEFKDS